MRLKQGVHAVLYLAVFGVLTPKLAAMQDRDYFVDVGRGPVPVNVPPLSAGELLVPLVVLLHGYAGTAEWEDDYFGMTPLSDRFGFLYTYPDGCTDTFGYQYWNGTDACCDWTQSTDDSSYLRALIEEICRQSRVDPNRIYVIGHSNGGFMAYRMACDHSDLIAGVVSLAGADWLRPARNCAPASPVHVLQIHGTSDNLVFFDGGCFLDNDLCYPGATESIQHWSWLNSCLPVVEEKGVLDLTLEPGAETTVLSFGTRCEKNGSATLWSIANGGHVPAFHDDWTEELMAWIDAHPKLDSQRVPAKAPR